MTADEEVAVNLANFTGERLAKLLLILVDTVSRTHPDLLREALGRVFDLGVYEEEARKAQARLGLVHEDIGRARRQLRALRHEAAELTRLVRPDPPADAAERP